MQLQTNDQTPINPTEPEPAPETPEIEATPMTEDDLAAVRQLALRAYPETVPELVAGETIEALLSSLEPAAAAYRRIAEGVVTTASTAPPVAPTVPAGSAPPVSIDPDTLPSVEKIRRGLAARR